MILLLIETKVSEDVKIFRTSFKTDFHTYFFANKGVRPEKNQTRDSYVPHIQHGNTSLSKTILTFFDFWSHKFFSIFRTFHNYEIFLNLKRDTLINRNKSVGRRQNLHTSFETNFHE